MNSKLFLSLISAVALFAGCAETKQPVEQVPSTQDLPSSLYVDDVCVDIIPGAELQTKADGAFYYTLVGNDGISTYTIMVETQNVRGGLMFCRHYTQNGELIATFVYLNNTIVNVEIEGAFAETKAQGYVDCVKSTYKQLREQLQEDLMRECDLGLGACDAASAVVAVVKCTSAKNR